MIIEDYLYPLCSLICSAIATAIMMPWLLELCKKRGLYDMPNERKVHANKIPRLGGVLFAPAMMIGMSVTLGIMIVTGTHTPPGLKLSAMVIFTGMFLIYCVGVVDDILGLDAKFKFIVQFITALFMPLCGLYINDLYGFMGIHEIPMWIGYPLSIFITLLIVNAINLIDGIDGLASGLGLISLSVMLVGFLELQVVSYTIFAAGLIGTVFAFFCFNMFGKEERNTKTFMGDTGSLIIGYALTFLVFKYAMNNPNVLPYRASALLVAYTVLIVPTFDLIRVALSRLRNGVPIFHADKTHLHHKFMAAGYSMRATLYWILGIQLAYCATNVVLYKFGVSTTVIIFSNVAVFCVINILLNKKIKTLQKS